MNIFVKYLIFSAFFLSGNVFAQNESKALRIMPLGDSITAGYTDNSKWEHPFEFGYRSGLFKRMKKAEIDFVFVGESKEPLNNKFGDPTHGGKVLPKLDLRNVGQDGHRGYGGWGIGAIQQNIAEWMKKDQPDIILLMLGINGINPNSPQQLKSLVETIFKTDSKVHVIIAQITPYGKFNQTLFNYNTFIREKLVPELKTQKFKISTVDQYKHFLTDPKDPKSIDAKRLSNGFNHPGNKEYDQMAETWFKGIKAVLKN